MSGQTSIIRADMQPIFVTSANGANAPNRGNANRLIAPLFTIAGLAAQMPVITDQNVLDDSGNARDITKPVDLDAPIKGGRITFSPKNVDVKRYGPGEHFISDVRRAEFARQGIDIDALHTSRLAARADDIHYAAVFDALQTSGNYKTSATGIGDISDQGLKFGRAIENALVKARVTQVGNVSAFVCNQIQLYKLNQLFDVSGKGRVAVAKATTDGNVSLGYEGENRFIEWMRSNFGLSTVVDRRVRITGGTAGHYLANTAMALIDVATQYGEGGFINTAVFGPTGIPKSDMDLGLVKSYRVNNPDGDALWADLMFSVYTSAEDGGTSPNGVMLSCTGATT